MGGGHSNSFKVVKIPTLADSCSSFTVDLGITEDKLVDFISESSAFPFTLLGYLKGGVNGVAVKSIQNNSEYSISFNGTSMTIYGSTNLHYFSDAELFYKERN